MNPCPISLYQPAAKRTRTFFGMPIGRDSAPPQRRSGRTATQGAAQNQAPPRSRAGAVAFAFASNGYNLRGRHTEEASDDGPAESFDHDHGDCQCTPTADDEPEQRRAAGKRRRAQAAQQQPVDAAVEHGHEHDHDHGPPRSCTRTVHLLVRVARTHALSTARFTRLRLVELTPDCTRVCQVLARRQLPGVDHHRRLLLPSHHLLCGRSASASRRTAT